MIDDHAKVKVSGMEIPLIGVSPFAVLEECDCCHDMLPLDAIALTGPQFLCRKCRAAGSTDAFAERPGS